MDRLFVVCAVLAILFACASADVIEDNAKAQAIKFTSMLNTKMCPAMEMLFVDGNNAVVKSNNETFTPFSLCQATDFSFATLLLTIDPDTIVVARELGTVIAPGKLMGKVNNCGGDMISYNFVLSLKVLFSSVVGDGNLTPLIESAQVYYDTELITFLMSCGAQIF